MPPAAPPATTPGPGGCLPPGIAALVGQSDAVVETMRFDRPTRIIRPGMAVTMDYSPDRVNIEIDESGTITGVRCY